MNSIDTFLDKITMYRLVLYYLFFVLFGACILGGLGILHYAPSEIFLSTVLLIGICWVSNKILAWIFTIPPNTESSLISALILALILSPLRSIHDIPVYFWAGVLAMASKYIFTINTRHIFNPVAIAVAMTAWGFGASASWWVGTAALLPFSLLGILIVRKIRRFDVFFSFFISTIIVIVLFTFLREGNALKALSQSMLSSPLVFFASIMLTEPLTAPPTKMLQVLYGILVGIFFAPQFHIGSYTATPEQALLIGNVFAYFVSPKSKIIARVEQKIQYGSDILDLRIPLPKKLSFVPGQYMEWTLGHKNVDSRGNRRYFTIASSPTEDVLRLGIKFYPNGSSYKKALWMLEHPQIIGSQIRGDFTLPKDKNQKLVFIAGGIGITPFRSMIKYLVDTKERRPLTLLYANKKIDEIMYTDVFFQAQQELGLKVVYTLTDTSQTPTNWTGRVGRIDQDMIQEAVGDISQCVFYLSGPRSMVLTYEKTLKAMGVEASHIKIDFFPGFV